MMQKLKFFICLTAVLLLGTQVLTAQSSISAEDPTSPAGWATNGRFGNDVDNFFGVNDWADVTLSKWFGYLSASDIELRDGTSTPGVWEGGLALKLSTVYVGLYYYGKFNTGAHTAGYETIGYDDNVGSNRTGPTFTWTSGNFSFLDGDGAALNAKGAGITRRNYFGVLLGIGNHGFKVSVLENLATIDLPYITTTGDIDYDGVTGTDIPANSYGAYSWRNGDITPKIQWGAAQDMAFGKYATRPSASLALKVAYANNWALTGLKTEDGDNLGDIDNYNTGASIIPTVGIDTGGIKFFSGDWGTLAFGAADEFTFKVTGKGQSPGNDKLTQPNAGTGTGNDQVAWENNLSPYATFSYQATDYLSLGAKLNIPIWFGGSNGDDTYFGVGARGTGVNGTDTKMAKETAYPTLGVGLQLKGTFLDKLIEKFGIFDMLTFNAGIKVNLPAYLYSGTYTYVERDPDTTPVTNAKITKEYKHEWFSTFGDQNNGSNIWVQMLYYGLTVHLTPNIFVDAQFGWGNGNDYKNTTNQSPVDATALKLVVSAKY